MYLTKCIYLNLFFHIYLHSKKYPFQKPRQPQYLHPYLLQTIGITTLLQLKLLNYNCLMKNKEF